jgi:hypothetical protein
MAVTKRNGKWYAYFRPFKDNKIWLRLYVEGKTEARQLEAVILRACRTGRYGGLDEIARDHLVRMWANQQWQLPPELGGVVQAPNRPTSGQEVIHEVRGA